MSAERLSIGKLAKKSATSVRMLRYFEKFGLLQPIRHGIRRFYRPEDGNKVATIKVFQSLGLNLKTVRDLKSALAANANDKAIQISMNAAARTDLEIEKLEKQRFFLARLHTKLSRGESPHSYHCFLCDSRDDQSRNWWGSQLNPYSINLKQIQKDISLTKFDQALKTKLTTKNPLTYCLCPGRRHPTLGPQFLTTYTLVEGGWSETLRGRKWVPAAK